VEELAMALIDAHDVYMAKPNLNGDTYHLMFTVVGSDEKSNVVYAAVKIAPVVESINESKYACVRFIRWYPEPHTPSPMVDEARNQRDPEDQLADEDFSNVVTANVNAMQKLDLDAKAIPAANGPKHCKRLL
jgi:hypothetical protein